MLIAVSGLVTDHAGNIGSIGAGKDSAADRLVAGHSFAKIAFADPAKRFLKDVYAFDNEQLWGSKKDVPDERYKRPWTEEEKRLAKELNSEPVDFLTLLSQYPLTQYLTPRYALQTLLSSWGRDMCWEDTWAVYAIRVAKKLMENSARYSPQAGVLSGGTNIPERAVKGVAFSDLRFKNELACVKLAGGRVIRVRRSVSRVQCPSAHLSENDLGTLPDEAFDYVIHNDSTIEHLAVLVDRMMDCFQGRIREYDEAQEDVPPFMRKP